MKTRWFAGAIVLASAIVALAMVHYSFLSEAYGEGPPYYRRTINMDKWSSPWPILTTLDVAAAIVTLAFVTMFVRSHRQVHSGR